MKSIKRNSLRKSRSNRHLRRRIKSKRGGSSMPETPEMQVNDDNLNDPCDLCGPDYECKSLDPSNIHCIEKKIVKKFQLKPSSSSKMRSSWDEEILSNTMGGRRKVKSNKRGKKRRRRRSNFRRR